MSVPSSPNPSICQSIKSPTEPHDQCLFPAKPGKKYCGLHLSYANVTDYTHNMTNMNNNQPSNISPNTSPDIKKEQSNPIFSSYVLSNISSNVSSDNNQPDTKTTSCRSTKPTKKIPPKKIFATPKEQQTKTIIDTYQTNENDLEVKLLIMINDDECLEKITKLIGPCFNDVTLSEDQEDPVTMDKIWTYQNGIKVGTDINKYHLFSYVDSKSKIRCLTVFTLYDMIQSNDLVHPITTEPIPEPDVIRAKELIDLYTAKLNLFNCQSDTIMSPEYKLKNKISQLFKRFHIHSIFFEESWLTSITDEDKLFRIIKETDRLVKSNIKSINPNVKNIDVFLNVPQKRTHTVKKKNIKSGKKYDSDDDDEDKSKSTYLILLKEYIQTNWEKLINSADNENNQIPIWIIAHGLSFVVPDVKIKYPELELMIQ